MLASIIYPHQLFRRNPALTGSTKRVYLIEEPLYFSLNNFHKQKLVLHRATMKFYADFLTKKKFDVRYVEYHEIENGLNDSESLVKLLKKDRVSSVDYVEPTDYWLENRFVESCEAAKIQTTRHDTPMFFNTKADVENYFGAKKRYFMAAFYQHERKRLKILVDEKGEPTGGKWSFDEENRKPFSSKIEIPKLKTPKPNEFTKEAIEYVNNRFADNYGNAEDFAYSTTYAEAEKWLDEFLRERFKDFGAFEDAISQNETHLFHGVLTHALNVGLLTPRQVIDKAISYADENKIPLNSLEGFVRQIIGWREFMRGSYQVAGRKQRLTNFWKFKRRLPKSFWTGETGILPVDTVIKRTLKNAYCHHIERLMIMGNFMLVCEIAPDDVYLWFMEMFIDAYDWVMVPNTYGMSQHADGGLVATKPYFSGSNYVRKMSDYPAGDWTEIWDGLYWRFVANHKDFFLKNPRMSLSVRSLEKMNADKRERLLNTAENYLKTMDKSR